ADGNAHVDGCPRAGELSRRDLRAWRAAAVQGGGVADLRQDSRGLLRQHASDGVRRVVRNAGDGAESLSYWTARWRAHLLRGAGTPKHRGDDGDGAVPDRSVVRLDLVG